MDTGEEYVKMCMSAKEIQSIYEFSDLHDYVTWEEDVETLDGAFKCWLPRQDQLQDMIIANRKMISNPIDLFKVLVYWLSDTEALDFDPDGLLNFDTMEKMWLAYYMKTTFHKKWNGEEWV